MIWTHAYINGFDVYQRNFQNARIVNNGESNEITDDAYRIYIPEQNLTNYVIISS